MHRHEIDDHDHADTKNIDLSVSPINAIRSKKQDNEDSIATHGKRTEITFDSQVTKRDNAMGIIRDTPTKASSREMKPGFALIPNCRILRTIAIFASFVSCGLTVSLLGTTLVSMEILLGASTKQMGFAATSTTTGLLTGSLLTGVLYDRMDRNLMFTLALLLVTICTAVASFTGALIGYIVCWFGIGVGNGIAAAGGESYVLSLWQGHRYQGPMLQAMHTIFSVTVALGPFIIQPFLPDISFLFPVNNGTFSGNNITASNEFFTENMTIYGLLTQDEITTKVSSVRFAFVTISSLIFVCFVVFGVTFCVTGRSIKSGGGESHHRHETHPKQEVNKRFRINVLIFVSCLFFLYFGLENISITYIAGFLVKGLGYPNAYSSLIMSTFFGTITMGRLLSTALAAHLRVQHLLSGLFTLSISAGILMLFCKHHGSIIWIATTAWGLGLSAVFPTLFLLAADYITLSGTVASVFLICGSIGGISGTFITGYILDIYGQWLFTDVLFSVCAVLVALYMTGQIYLSYCQKSKSHPSTDIEITIPE